nr:PREDICTED: taste receptor type 2 member 140-like [Anolis carolinensis]|eukprot:XP_016849639.1 PREDICTED: taste receptor type 2 member 140-like [Anolis carolinensis]
MAANQMPPYAIISWCIIGILCIVSLSGNGFIFIVTVLQWLQKRKMPPCDFLLTCLSASRLLTQLNAMAIYFMELFYPSSRSAMLFFSWVLLNMASLWCVSWLSIFYCVKVINFSNSLLLWLKLRINLLLPKLLGISVVIFMVSSLPSIFTFHKCNEPCNQTVTPLINEKPGNMWISFFPVEITFTCINFSMNIAATLLLLISLWRHVRNLRKNGTSVRDLNTQVHLKVMRPLLITLLLYLLFIASLITMATGFLNLQTKQALIGEIMVTIFPSVHAIILIWTNPKLREVAAHMLNIRQSA